MQRRNFPSILLYSFGLALTLSLVFNGFLLAKQSRQLSLYPYESGDSGHVVNNAVWQQQLLECQRSNQQKDSLIHQLEQASNLAPSQVATAQHRSSN